VNIARTLKSKLIKITLIFSISSLDSLSTTRRLEFETKHFRVIYDKDLQREADILNSKADHVAEELFEALKFKPSRRINIIMSHNDLANAFVVPVKPLCIYMFPNTALGNMGTPVEDILRHELVHSILAQKSPIKLGSQRLNLAPMWMHEGTAVYFETHLTKDRGRGKSNLFSNIPKSFSQISFEKINESRVFLYELGYSFMNFYEKRYGKDAMIELIDTYSKTLLRFFDLKKYNIVYEWNDSVEKSTPVGEIFLKNTAYHLTGGGKFLCFSDGEKIVKMDVSKGKQYYVSNATNVRYFKFDGENLTKTLVFISNLPIDFQITDQKYKFLGYINGSLIDQKSNKITASFEDKVIFVNTENGRESLLIKEDNSSKVLIDQDSDLIFFDLMFSEAGIFFIGKNYYERGTYLFKLENGKIERICESNPSAYIYGSKIYFTKDTGSKISLYEYSDNNSKVKKIIEGDTIENPVRIEDKIYFNQHIEGFPHIYFTDLEYIDEMNIIKQEYNAVKHSFNSPTSKRYSPKLDFTLPILYCDQDMMKIKQGIGNEANDFIISLFAIAPFHAVKNRFANKPTIGIELANRSIFVEMAYNMMGKISTKTQLNIPGFISKIGMSTAFSSGVELEFNSMLKEMYFDIKERLGLEINSVVLWASIDLNSSFSSNKYLPDNSSTAATVGFSFNNFTTQAMYNSNGLIIISDESMPNLYLKSEISQKSLLVGNRMAILGSSALASYYKLELDIDIKRSVSPESVFYPGVDESMLYMDKISLNVTPGIIASDELKIYTMVNCGIDFQFKILHIINASINTSITAIIRSQAYHVFSIFFYLH